MNINITYLLHFEDLVEGTVPVDNVTQGEVGCLSKVLGTDVTDLALLAQADVQQVENGTLDVH